MADGYALLEVNTEGQGRLQDGMLHWYDFRLDGNVYWDDIEGTEQLMGQLPDLKDCLVMVHFDYESSCYQGYEGDWDCEELVNLSHYYIVKEGYKEFYRELVTIELDSFNEFDEGYKDVVLEAVSEWEEFYDEDFVPFKKQPKMINGVIDLWQVIQEKDS